jgi:uncharacterized protein
MSRVVHFEIPADNPQALMDFYGGVFGWQYQKFGDLPYWAVTTGPEDTPGINGGIMARNHPEQPCVNTIAVASIEDTLAAVATAGGSCVVPKMPIPGVGWLAYCKDPEGNIFGIHVTDPSAA